MIYPRNFLTLVIARIDLGLAHEMTTEAVKQLQADLQPAFPLYVTESRNLVEFQFAPDSGGTSKQHAYTAHVLKSSNSLNSLTLEPTSITFELKEYQSYEAFRPLIERTVSKYRVANAQLAARRLGLRYVNHIRIPHGNPFDWVDIVHPSLSGGLAFWEDRAALSRLVGVAEQNDGERKLRFQYGWHNSEFPNPVSRREFLLDFDRSSDEDRGLSTVPDVLSEFNITITALFERSIGARARAWLQGDDGAF